MAINMIQARQRMEKALTNILMREGEKIAKKTINNVGTGHENGTYLNRTLNMHDAYVWAVYNHGKLVPDAYGCMEESMAEEPIKWYGKEMWGHELAMSFIRTFRPIQKGYALVVAVVTPYADIVEHKYKYRVISSAQQDMQDLANRVKLKGASVHIIHRGKVERS